MKPASIPQIKKELSYLSQSELAAMCLRLAKYKKDNKELLSYLLFETNENNFIEGIKTEIDEQLRLMNQSHIYYLKKSLRKTIRFVDRFMRYSGNKETEIEVRKYLCEELKAMSLPFSRSTQLQNLYDRQIIKIKHCISTLHEDLQYDYLREIKEL